MELPKVEEQVPPQPQIIEFPNGKKANFSEKEVNLEGTIVAIYKVRP